MISATASLGKIFSFLLAAAADRVRRRRGCKETSAYTGTKPTYLGTGPDRNNEFAIEFWNVSGLEIVLNFKNGLPSRLQAVLLNSRGSTLDTPDAGLGLLERIRFAFRLGGYRHVLRALTRSCLGYF
jgi:hypothetical protein